MKEKGILSPIQSQYLGRLFSSPYFDVKPRAKDALLNYYFELTADDERPDSLPPEAQKLISDALLVGEKYVELGEDAEALNDEEIVDLALSRNIS